MVNAKFNSKLWISNVTRAIKVLNERNRALAAALDAHEAMLAKAVVRPENSVPATVKNRKTGERAINPLKAWVKPFQLRTTTGQRTVLVPANGKNVVSFVVPAETNLVGDCEIFSLKLAAATSKACRVKIKHNGIGRYLMNQPVILPAVFADMTITNPSPMELCESIFLQSGMELTVELYDFSGSDNTIELVVEGRRFLGYGADGLTRDSLMDVFEKRLSFPFWLTTDSVPSLAANTNAFATQATMTVDRGFDLELVSRMQYASTSSSLGAFDYRLQVFEGPSGVLLDDDVLANCWGGTGAYPYMLKETWLAKRATPITINLTNGSATANRSVDLVYHGRGLPYRALLNAIPNRDRAAA